MRVCVFHLFTFCWTTSMLFLPFVHLLPYMPQEEERPPFSSLVTSSLVRWLLLFIGCGFTRPLSHSTPSLCAHHLLQLWQMCRRCSMCCLTRTVSWLDIMLYALILCCRHQLLSGKTNNICITNRMHQLINNSGENGGKLHRTPAIYYPKNKWHTNYEFTENLFQTKYHSLTLWLLGKNSHYYIKLIVGRIRECNPFELSSSKVYKRASCFRSVQSSTINVRTPEVFPK
jgi:hypothetical protein